MEKLIVSGNSKTYMESVESLHFGGDFSRGQFALAAPFLKKSKEHSVWAKFALFAQTL